MVSKTDIHNHPLFGALDPCTKQQSLMGFASRPPHLQLKSTVAMGGATVTAVAAAAARLHHRHFSTLQQCHYHRERLRALLSSPPKQRKRLVVVLLHVGLLMLTLLPPLMQTHAFIPAHRHIERPSITPPSQRNSKERSNGEFFYLRASRYIKYFTIKFSN